MTAVSLESFTKKYKELVEIRLDELVTGLQAPEKVKEAMSYSLKAGGKRIRPVLLFATLHAFRKDPAIGLEAAAALEMIHTYSLIHDDLPSMDNDDLRRGKPTNHKVYGEATAILAGDGLLTYSFEVLCGTKGSSPEKIIRLISLLAKSAGPEGMVGGQAADMEGENKSLTVEELQYIHKNKTGRLLAFSVMAAAILADASESQVRSLEDYAYHIGLAFQIQDDILDVEGREDKMGKRVGSDESKFKSTYPALLTLEGAKEKLENHLQKGKSALLSSDLDNGLLVDIAEMIASRDH
ncbi:polyprenyl synthetase family protein [Rossellomorea vietnamensis]|uniref:Farnesyl diphosphate synthase n=1 Tax=Rossellomorea vietnamensis TaxID=218284 RepID=A0A5D4KGA7_9BACI|nr:farnesyl diphosphate synthase [Rossellomorea vietnamensis]TYR76317.1 polyprenyl synthetase family protein [Rossellomorea vietnamensis]